MRFLLSVLGVLLTLAVPASASWTPPVPGPVVGRFHVGPDPFAAGQRRGVDLAASPGDPVVAPCAGRVAFAGAVPRFRLGVSIRCGTLTATVLGLGRAAVRSGEAVRRGADLGSVGSDGRVRLGARVTRQQFGYRDPLTLLGAEPGARAPLIGPRGTRRPSPPPDMPAIADPVGAPSAAAPAAAPSAPIVTAPEARPAGAPVLAWIGLALVACALPGGAIAWRVRRGATARARSRVSGGFGPLLGSNPPVACNRRRRPAE